MTLFLDVVFFSGSVVAVVSARKIVGVDVGVFVVVAVFWLCCSCASRQTKVVIVDVVGVVVVVVCLAVWWLWFLSEKLLVLM